MNEVVNSHLAAVAIAAVLLFGNELLVHHLLVTQCIAIKILEYIRVQPMPETETFRNGSRKTKYPSRKTWTAESET